MRKDGWPAMCIHGDKQQKERDWVLGEFKSVFIKTLANSVAERSCFFSGGAGSNFFLNQSRSCFLGGSGCIFKQARKESIVLVSNMT